MSFKFWRRTLVLAGVILGVIVLPAFALATERKDAREVLTDRLYELKSQIQAYRSEINNLKVQQKDLEREIALADLEIKKVEAQIKVTDLAIKESNAAIGKISEEISGVQTELDRQKNHLVYFLKLLSEQDRESMVEVVLIEDSLDSFLSKSQEIKSIQAELLKGINKVTSLKAVLEDQKQKVEARREEDLQLKAIQQLQKISQQKKIANKESLIKDGQVRSSLLGEQKQQAEEAIEQARKHLYILGGTNGSMTLEEAYKRAALVAGKVGVRPAFLLAIIKKETEWGGNIGSGIWRQDMHPRDHAAFLAITKKLGLNPDAMPVSAKPEYGWGGALGPAQFLPTTWLAYEDKIASITGHNPPSPWDLEDAFAAAGLKLSANGANEKFWQAEWKAAQIYFAGGNWDKPQYSFYGDAVMELAEAIQEQIELK